MTKIVAISSAAITANTMSAESSVINRESGGNADGAFAYHMFAAVASDQSGLAGNTNLELHSATYEPNSASYTDENDDDWGDYSLVKKVPASDGSSTAFSVYMGIHYPQGTREKFKLKAADYGVTCNLVIVPVYPADA